MASFHTQFTRSLSLSARLMRKPNIQRPIVPGTERRLLDAVTVPVFPPDLRPPPMKCFEEMKMRKERKKSELSDAYNAFRLKQAIKVFSENKMIAVCHALPMSSRDNLVLRTQLQAAQLKLIHMRNDIAVKATENSKFHNLAPFFNSTNVYIVSEDIKVVELVKVLKKVSDLHLLGGVVEDRIVSREGMMNIAQLPPIDILQGELLTILKAPASKTHRLLGRHQQELSRCLDQLSKPATTNDSSEATIESER